MLVAVSFLVKGFTVKVRPKLLCRNRASGKAPDLSSCSPLGRGRDNACIKRFAVFIGLVKCFPRVGNTRNDETCIGVGTTQSLHGQSKHLLRQQRRAAFCIIFVINSSSRDSVLGISHKM